jgi:hypothetical protein
LGSSFSQERRRFQPSAAMSSPHPIRQAARQKIIHYLNDANSSEEGQRKKKKKKKTKNQHTFFLCEP